MATKTAMQELIEFMKTKRYNTDGVTLCENKATELLEKEKQQIIDAVNSANDVDTNPRGVTGQILRFKYISGEDYYTQTYTK